MTEVIMKRRKHPFYRGKDKLNVFGSYIETFVSRKGECSLIWIWNPFEAKGKLYEVMNNICHRCRRVEGDIKRFRSKKKAREYIYRRLG